MKEVHVIPVPAEPTVPIAPLPDEPKPAWTEPKQLEDSHNPRVTPPSMKSNMEWDDDEASIETIVYSPPGLRTFFGTKYAKGFVTINSCLCCIMILLGATRPIGGTGWPRFDLELGNHHFAFIETWFALLVLFIVQLLLLLKGHNGLAAQVCPSWMLCMLANLLPGIFHSIIAEDYGFMLYCIIHSIVLAYGWWVCIMQGLFILRLLQAACVGFTFVGLSLFVLGDPLWGTMFLLTTMELSCLLGFFAWKRKKALRQSMAMMQQDVRSYEEKWAQLNSEPAILDELAHEVQAIKCKQSITQSLSDLSELYVQGVAAKKAFDVKMDRWAKQVGGKSIPSKLKTQKRAMQKIMRSYNGDATRLSDIVRGALVFEYFEDLLAVFRKIATDPEVQIHRIKNRFDLNYDAALSAGYRDVCILVTISTDENKKSGADQHVCEVQMHMAAILAIKSDAGHKRYVKWRNIRCE